MFDLLDMTNLHQDLNLVWESTKLMLDTIANVF